MTRPAIPETLPHALLSAYLEESPFLPEAPERTAWFLGLVEAAYAAGFTDARTGGGGPGEAQKARAAAVLARVVRPGAARGR